METINDFPKHETKLKTSTDVLTLRKNAPSYFVSLIEEGLLENISSLRDIPSKSMVPMGRLDGACYFYENNGRPEVVKFGNFPAYAESQALTAFGKLGVDVPRVKGAGVVPSTVGDEQPVKYIVLEGITTKKGDPAPTGDEYIATHPDQTQALAIKMADELIKVHSVPCDMPFGGFADKPDRNAESVAEYFTDEIDDTRDIIESLGLTTEQITAIKDTIKTIEFPQKGVIVFGDFAPFNVLIQSEDPLTIKSIDPIPRVMDPYWDIARLVNTYELIEALAREDFANQKFAQAHELERLYKDAFLERYVSTTGQQIDPKRLLANQIICSLGQTQRHETRQIQARPVGNAQILVDQDVEVKLMRQLLSKRITSLVNI